MERAGVVFTIEVSSFRKGKMGGKDFTFQMTEPMIYEFVSTLIPGKTKFFIARFSSRDWALDTSICQPDKAENIQEGQKGSLWPPIFGSYEEV